MRLTILLTFIFVCFQVSAEEKISSLENHLTIMKNTEIAFRHLEDIYLEKLKNASSEDKLKTQVEFLRKRDKLVEQYKHHARIVALQMSKAIDYDCEAGKIVEGELLVCSDGSQWKKVADPMATNFSTYDVRRDSEKGKYAPLYQGINDVPPTSLSNMGSGN